MFDTTNFLSSYEVIKISTLVIDYAYGCWMWQFWLLPISSLFNNDVIPSILHRFWKLVFLLCGHKCFAIKLNCIFRPFISPQFPFCFKVILCCMHWWLKGDHRIYVHRSLVIISLGENLHINSWYIAIMDLPLIFSIYCNENLAYLGLYVVLMYLQFLVLIVNIRLERHYEYENVILTTNFYFKKFHFAITSLVLLFFYHFWFHVLYPSFLSLPNSDSHSLLTVNYINCANYTLTVMDLLHW